MTQIAIAFQKYIEGVLGLHVQLKAWETSSRLPVFLRDSFDFYRVVLLETSLLLAADKSIKEQPPATIQKQLAQIRGRWNHEVVYVRSAVSSHNRQRLIRYKVAFVVPGNQMYLPMLGIDLREHFRKIRDIRRIVSPSTQALMLFLLYAHQRGPVTPSRMSSLLGYSPMSMTRAFAELERIGMGEHVVRGKNRELRLETSGTLLWERLLPYLRSPVRKRLYAEGGRDRRNLVKAGLTALACYSSIAEPAIPVYAVDRDEWKELCQDFREIPHPEPGSAEFEIWNYCPNLFQKDMVADRLSVYLSLKDLKDERIEITVEEMMRGMSW